MSRIGKMPIKIPEKVKVTVQDANVRVEGPKGKLSFGVNPLMKVEVKDGQIVVNRPDDERISRGLHGLTRTLLNNAVKGVTQGYEDILDIAGVGYRAEVKGNELTLSVGLSHPVVIKIPEGLTCDVEKQTRVTIRGADKQLVGMTSSGIRKIRKCEPYKGKGIKYANEKVRRKVGKQGAA